MERPAQGKKNFELTNVNVYCAARVRNNIVHSANLVLQNLTPRKRKDFARLRCDIAAAGRSPCHLALALSLSKLSSDLHSEAPQRRLDGTFFDSPLERTFTSTNPPYA